MAGTSRRRRSIFDLMKDYAKKLEALSDELHEALVADRPSWDTRTCCIEPLCSIFVSVDEVVVTADLPNTDPNSITIEPIDRSTLEIKASMKRKMRFDELGVAHRKGEFRFFRCQVNIPVPVDIEKPKMQFKRGILEVHLPRKKGYRIRVE